MLSAIGAFVHLTVTVKYSYFTHHVIKWNLPGIWRNFHYFKEDKFWLL